MLGFGKSKSTPPPAAPVSVDVVSGFPRGLPDGDEHKPMATARWASSADACRLLGEWKPGRFLLGRDASGRYIGVEDNRHLLTVAGSRAGKGVSLIVPNLCLWPGSVLAIDPKGELATVTACRRASESLSDWAVPMGGKVFVLDPFLRVKGPAADFRAAYNPLADLDPDSDAGIDLAGQLADALIIQQEGSGSYWTLSARSFLRGLILFICKHEPAITRNLLAVRRWLLGGDIDALLLEMTKHGGAIARAASALQTKPREERSSTLATCEAQTDFLEGKPMERVLSHSDFRLEDLKAGRVTVYLCLPATRLGTHGRWLRLIVAMALEAMETTGLMDAGQTPVLFVLDELAALGHMESIEKAAGQIAGYGCRLWSIVQDLTQLQRDYKDGWQTFMGNAGLLTAFGNMDLFTLDHLAKRLGECEVIRTVTNLQESWQQTRGGSGPNLVGKLIGGAFDTVSHNDTSGGNQAISRSVSKALLMNPDELARHFAREGNKILALIPHPDYPPFALNRCLYFGKQDDALFGGLFDPVGEEKPLTRADERLKRQAFSEVLKPNGASPASAAGAA